MSTTIELTEQDTTRYTPATGQTRVYHVDLGGTSGPVRAKAIKAVKQRARWNSDLRVWVIVDREGDCILNSWRDAEYVRRLGGVITEIVGD